MNGRENEAFVVERLDKAYASYDWINLYPYYALQNHPILRSNHGSILLDFEMQQPFRKRPFRFERMWLAHMDCKKVVEDAWKTHLVGSRAFKLQQKIINVKRKFLSWNKTVFGRVDRGIKDLQLKLQQIQDSIHTVEDVKLEKNLRLELESLMDKKEVMWAQKARSNWTIQGDKNTKYFQTLVKQRRARNKILQLRKADSNLTEDLLEIETMFLDHLKD